MNDCDADTLALISLAEYSSLIDMDRAISEGRFLTAFAKRLGSSENKELLSLFEEAIIELHSQAESLGMSLKLFYEGAARVSTPSSLYAPSG